MYRVEIVEKTKNYGDITRISSPAKTKKEQERLINYFQNVYKQEIQNETHYIKIAFYNIIF